MVGATSHPQPLLNLDRRLDGGKDAARPAAGMRGRYGLADLEDVGQALEAGQQDLAADEVRDSVHLATQQRSEILHRNGI